MICFLELKLEVEQLSNPTSTKSTVLWQKEPYSHFCPQVPHIL